MINHQHFNLKNTCQTIKILFVNTNMLKAYKSINTIHYQFDEFLSPLEFKSSPPFSLMI